VGMRRSEQGWVLLRREVYIQQRRRQEGRKEGKDEIIVEMSEMCLRALHSMHELELTLSFILGGKDFGHHCGSCL